MLKICHGRQVKMTCVRLSNAFGQVESVNIVKDRISGESRGYGFVSMPAKTEAQKLFGSASFCLCHNYVSLFRVIRIGSNAELR